MTGLLYRLASWSVRRRWAVISGWVVIIAVLAALAAAFHGATSDAFTIPGTESQRALDVLAKEFPGTGGATARIVVAAPPGHKVTEPQYVKLGQAALAQIAKAPQVKFVAPLTAANVSKDQRIAFVTVQYAVSVDKITQQARDALEAAAAPAAKAGLEVEYSGGVISTTTKEGNNDLYGIIIAFFVLTITFGSLVSAGLPLLTGILGVAVGLLSISALSGVIALSSTAPTLALMLGLAVGIDYTLFILSRHRQHLRDGVGYDDSIRLATATAGGAVVFAGLTVVIALSALSVVGIPFLTVMGLAAAGTVVCVVLLALTMLPAVLAVLGPRINKGRIGFLAKRHERHEGGGKLVGGERWSRIVTAKPWVTLVLVIAGILVIAWPTLHLKLGLPDDGTKPKSTTERRAYDLLSQGFGVGFNGPLTLVVYAPGHTDTLKLVTGALPQIQKSPDVAEVSQPLPNPKGDVVIVNVIPRSAPSSTATNNLVAQLRDGAAKVREQTGINAYVTGPTATNIDVSHKLGSALPEFLIVIVVLALLLLLLVFRSLLVPVKAVIGFLLSIGASFGLTVWVFQEGHLGSLFQIETPAPIVSFLPILVVGILFGLAMDYQVFLVSRVREDFIHHHDAKGAINSGMRNSARVVTAAALIMFSVFGSFIFGDNAVIKSLGLALAFGVLVDAFIVRMTFVPAVLAVLGRVAWSLPKWLDRALPDIDLEGSKLSGAAAASHESTPPVPHR
ncbi:MAG TPA: MMPL family transporter [Frankiaceae bacterium]|jgi:RND superfamily putative drug exporter|nr:MMPL family transporter [Frankiaceae bacterium]